MMDNNIVPIDVYLIECEGLPRALAYDADTAELIARYLSQVKNEFHEVHNVIHGITNDLVDKAKDCMVIL